MENKTWLGAIVMTIKVFFAMLTSAVNVLDEGVAMADEAVGVARVKQAIDLAGEVEDYSSRVVDERGLNRVRREEAIREYIGDNAERKALVDHARTQLRATIEAEIARIEASRKQRM